MDEDGEETLQPPILDNDSDDEFLIDEAQSSESEGECHELQPMRPICDTELDVPSPQDEDTISGSGIGDIPNDLETCLAINKAYQDILLETIDRLSLALEQNRELQANIPKTLAERSKVSLARRATVVSIFVYPYFRDKYGMPAPPNEDERMKRANEEISPYLRPQPPWTTEEIEALRQGVHSSLMLQAVESCMNRKEILAQKLVLKRNPELEKRVREIESEIEQIRSLDIRELQARTNRPPDWLRISAVDFEGMRSDVSCELMWKHLLRPELNQSKWSPEEETRLKEIAVKWQQHNWEEIAKELNSGRSAFQCAQHYYSKLISRIQYGPFTKEEDELLFKLVEVCRDGDHIPWRQVTHYMENRNRSQCISRWERALKPTLKRGRWTAEEDLLLLAALKVHGTNQWNKIGEALPNRSVAACRDRYVDHYKMDLVFGSFSSEEDSLLLDLVEKFGPKWALISQHMPWRGDNTILNRYKKLAQILNLESVDQVAEKRCNLPPSRIRRKHYTAHTRRRELLASLKQKVLSKRQQQQARRLLLDEEMEHKEYCKVYNSFLHQRKARLTSKQQQSRQGRSLNAAISRFLGVRTVMCPKQNFLVYECEENNGVQGVLRRMHGLPLEEEQLEPGPMTLFAEYFQRQILGWETELPTLPPPVLPPNVSTTATYSRLLARVKHLKIPEYMDDTELAHALSQSRAASVRCTACVSTEQGSHSRCLQCGRLQKIYKQYEMLRGRFLSYFLWPAILSTQPIEKPPPEQRGRTGRRSHTVKLRKRKRKSPWVTEKWRQHREAKRKAMEAQGSNSGDDNQDEDQNQEEDDEQNQNMSEDQAEDNAENGVDCEMDDSNETLIGGPTSEQAGENSEKMSMIIR